jgi:hypothetical protein
VQKSDPPDPAKIVEDTRALIRGGAVTAAAARKGLEAIATALRSAGTPSAALEPIDNLIADLWIEDQPFSSGSSLSPSSD